MWLWLLMLSTLVLVLCALIKLEEVDRVWSKDGGALLTVVSAAGEDSGGKMMLLTLMPGVELSSVAMAMNLRVRADEDVC
jgi:hypothetical protein